MKYKLKKALFFLLFFTIFQSIYSQNIYSTKNINGIEYYVYDVQAGEGLYSISKKFNVSQEEIIKTNPRIKDGLKAGESIFIPKKEKQIQQIVLPQETKQYILHEVTKKQTLFSISREYNVSVQEIIELNPELKNTGLLSGATIKIPKKKKSQSIIKDSLSLSHKTEDIRHYKIAYFLPFMTNSESVNPTAVKFIQFYMGSLLAINNAKNKNIKLEILTYDIEKTETKLYEVLNKPEIQEVDLIFGPAYSLQIPILADFAQRRRIYTVIPFSSNVKYLSSNPYVFQFNPNHQEKEAKIVDFLIENFQTENIVFVRTTGSFNFDKNTFIKEELNKYSIPYQEIKGEYIEKYLSSDKKNIFIFDTYKYGISKQYLSKLYQHSYQYDIAVIGEYGWRGTKGQRPKMYYISPFNGTAKGTTYYETSYHKFYGYTKPLLNPRFDLLGYDLTNCFISNILADSLDFKNKNTLYYKGVQSDFIFNRESIESGYTNKKLYILEDEARNE